MAKKKNFGKTHRFKHSEPSAAVAEPKEGVAAAQAASVRPRTSSVGTAVARDFSYVVTDLRRIGIMAAGLIGLELILWYVFGHTGLGNTIYHLVQV